jgi:hypothetical protein
LLRRSRAGVVKPHHKSNVKAGGGPGLSAKFGADGVVPLHLLDAPPPSATRWAPGWQPSCTSMGTALSRTRRSPSSWRASVTCWTLRATASESVALERARRTSTPALLLKDVAALPLTLGYCDSGSSSVRSLPKERRGAARVEGMEERGGRKGVGENIIMFWVVVGGGRIWER